LSSLTWLETSHDLALVADDVKPERPTSDEREEWLDREADRVEATARLYARYLPSLETMATHDSEAYIARDLDGNITEVWVDRECFSDDGYVGEHCDERRSADERGDYWDE
jgi:hypothetical protein